MSLTCELSGESLATAQGDVVVTPSGHICLKSLLLSKLAETGGLDPFNESPLSEDQLVTLQGASKQRTLPPRPQGATSMPAILSLLNKEYEALVLELFDTRKALEETRQELSQALYQNDAAVRVIARVTMERDTARRQLQEYQASGAPPVGDEGQTSKKRKLDETESPETEELPLRNAIPSQDLDQMVTAWEGLHKTRKARQKEAASKAPAADQLAQYASTGKKAWHKTNSKGILCVAQHGSRLFTADKKELVLYDCDESVVVHSGAVKGTVTCLAVDSTHTVVGFANGQVQVSTLSDENALTELGTLSTGDSPLVDVRLFPDGVHVAALASNGTLTLLRTGASGAEVISVFETDDTECTSGCLHPDGLIYIAGTKSGSLLVWDLKSQSLGSTLQDPARTDSIMSVEISNNGYHVAVAHASDEVVVWDLRKQSTIATLNDPSGENRLSKVATVRFDASGKYLAYGGVGGIRITTVKEWGVTASIETKKAGVNVVMWGADWIASSNSKKREVEFYGVP